MKNLSLIINGVLVAAVIVLFAFHFSGDKTPEAASTAAISSDGINIAYVNIDSILMQYDLASELNDALTQKGNSMKARLDKQAAEFEKDYQTFIDKAQRGIYLTQQRQQEAQQELAVKQQELQQLDAEYSQQLAFEQQKMNQQLFDSINSYINRFNTPEKYQVILGHSLGGNILYGSPQIDITDVIVEGLNKTYQKK